MEKGTLPNLVQFSSVAQLCPTLCNPMNRSMPGLPVHQCQGCILSLSLFNLYAEYIVRSAGPDESQAGIKIARRNINNLRYADDRAS